MGFVLGEPNSTLPDTICLFLIDLFWKITLLIKHHKGKIISGSRDKWIKTVRCILRLPYHTSFDSHIPMAHISTSCILGAISASTCYDQSLSIHCRLLLHPRDSACLLVWWVQVVWNCQMGGIGSSGGRQVLMGVQLCWEHIFISTCWDRPHQLPCRPGGPKLFSKSALGFPLALLLPDSLRWQLSWTSGQRLMHWGLCF